MRGISPEVARARATRRTKSHGPCTARVQPREHVLVVWGRSFLNTGDIFRGAFFRTRVSSRADVGHICARAGCDS